MTTATATGSNRAKPAKKRGGPTAEARKPFYWMVIPAIVAFFLFHTMPAIVGMFYSFTNYQGYGTWSFIGLSNYINLFSDDRIWSAYGFTFLFAISATILTNVIALAIALALNSKIKGQNFFRGIFFIPYVLSILVIGYVFKFIFATSLPKLLPNIPLFADNILTNETWAWVGIVILAVWQSSAFAIILYLAGLQTVPEELYEAASLDGASSARHFWSITFPMIWSFFTINMVLSLKNFLQVFDPIVALTNGGPGTSTESISLLIYTGGFSGGEFAYQTANSVVFFIVITVVSLLQFKVLQSQEVDH